MTTHFEEIRGKPNLAVYIFSYNRACHLDWSIETSLKCLPKHRCIVVDDNSDDPQTLDVLKKWGDKIEVLPARNVEGEVKTGGLYPNMTRALDHAIEERIDYALFTQDDVQFIRSMEAKDYALMTTYFGENPKVIQYLVHFIKRPMDDTDLAEMWSLNTSKSAYFRTQRNSTEKGNFCAGGIFDVKRTKEIIGRFEMSERENSRRMSEAGVYYGFSPYPLACNLPAPISYRGKKRALEHRFYEFLGGAGFHPIQVLSPSETRDFLSRDPEEIPLSEHLLECPTAPAPENWAAGGGSYLVVARGGWRKAVYQAIMFTKAIVKRALGRG